MESIIDGTGERPRHGVASNGYTNELKKELSCRDGAESGSAVSGPNFCAFRANLQGPLEKMTDQHLSELRFADLDLTPPVMQGIRDAGFERCTPIQGETLPIALSGRDVAGQAQTGTGTTAARPVSTL